MLNFFFSLLDRILGVLFALLFTQIPALISQYQNLLNGAILEARRTTTALGEISNRTGKTIKEFIQNHLDHSDGSIVALAKNMKLALERLMNYQEAQKNLEMASVWERPFYFVKHIDIPLFKEMNFQTTIHLSWETPIYALLGILTWYFISLLLQKVYWDFCSFRQKHK